MHEQMPENVKKFGSSRERLIWAAKKLFAQKGFKGATVREIASLADIRESQINHHFGSKEGLLQACLEGLEDTRLKHVEKYLSKPCHSTADFRSRLEYLVNELMDAHLHLYDEMKILYFIEMTDSEFPQEFQKKWFLLFTEIAKFIEASKKTGVVRKNVDSRFFVELVYNSLSYSMLFFRHLKKRSGVDLFKADDRQAYVQKHLDLLLPSVCRS
ncbi:MAG: TetR/AcrR family transcriptional regulator [Bdellovibrionota bacterium]